MARIWEKDDDTGLYRCNRCPDAALFNPALEHHECSPAAEVDDQEDEIAAPPTPPTSALGGYTADQIRDRQARLIDAFDAALESLAKAKNPRQVQTAQSRVKALEMLRRTLGTAYDSARDREIVELVAEYRRFAEMIRKSRGTGGAK